MIEGLLVKPKDTPAGPASLRASSPEVSEAVGVTLETYRELGYAPDAEEATESLTTAFNDLASTGYDGRFFVPAPAEVSFGRLLAAADNKRQQYVYWASLYSELWESSTAGRVHKGYRVCVGYTNDQLNAGPSSAIARLAIFNTAETGVDPVLHLLGKPYDAFVKNRRNPEAGTTQLEAVEEAKTSFAARHEGFELDTLDHRDFVIMALMDRIRGVDSKEQILSRGHMRIAKLGWHHIGPEIASDRVVGTVYSSLALGGQLVFSVDEGYTSSSIGIGLSVGRKSAQAWRA